MSIVSAIAVLTFVVAITGFAIVNVLVRIACALERRFHGL